MFNSELVDLTFDAAIKAYWRRDSFRRFLGESGISDSHLSSWTSAETKRAFLSRTFEKLVKAQKGPDLILRMAKDLSERQEFPDLHYHEDTKTKLKDAHEAVKKLKIHILKTEDKHREKREAGLARERIAELRKAEALRKQSLKSLEDRFNAFSTKLGTQQAGYEFEEWFFDLVKFFEVDHRPPYKTNGRQIDGSLTVQSTTYLVELKFTTSQAGAQEIDIFYSKVSSTADNTMGVMIAVSGYTGTAIEVASRPKSPLLLIDYNHLLLVLRGTMTLSEVIERVRRHASQTGKAYVSVDELGG